MGLENLNNLPTILNLSKTPAKEGVDVDSLPDTPIKIGKDSQSSISNGLASLKNLSPILNNDIINQSEKTLLVPMDSKQTPEEHSLLDNIFKPITTTPMIDASFTSIEESFGNIGVNLSSLFGRHRGESYLKQISNVQENIGRLIPSEVDFFHGENSYFEPIAPPASVTASASISND